MKPLTQEDLCDFDHIQRKPGLFTGVFPDSTITRLKEHGLVECRYDGAGALLGLSRVYPAQSLKETSHD